MSRVVLLLWSRRRTVLFQNKNGIVLLRNETQQNLSKRIKIGYNLTKQVLQMGTYKFCTMWSSTKYKAPNIFSRTCCSGTTYLLTMLSVC